MAKKIGITETVLRDAHQSLIATRMRTDEFVDILDTMDKKYPDNLFNRYGNINYDNDDVILAYETIGKKRGCIVSGGDIDYDKVSSIIIKDLREGKLGKVTFDEVN